MVTCPKCEGRKIYGPTYQNTYPAEALRYTCVRCGYSTTTPCKDTGKVSRITTIEEVIKKLDKYTNDEQKTADAEADQARADMMSLDPRLDIFSPAELLEMDNNRYK